MKIVPPRSCSRFALVAILVAVGAGYAAGTSAAVVECAQALGLAHFQRVIQQPESKKKVRGGGSRRSILSPIAPFILDHVEETDHN